MAILFKNNAATVLERGHNATVTYLDCTNPEVFPVIESGSGDYFYLTLVGENALEIVKATGYHELENYGTVIDVVRAQEGTSARVWPTGTRVEMRITAEALNSFVPTAVQIAKDNVDAIGVASTTNVGFAGVDGETTQANAEGVVTAKDVAVGGNLKDLASARGQIGNSKAQGSHDFSSGMLSEKPGMYTAINSGSTNVPFTGPFAEMILGTPTYRGSLLITSGRSTFPRAAISAINMKEGGGFSGYNRLITEQQVGDGIRVSDGIISVPEYDGATASTAGTAGLVPPAVAGQQESFLTGGGEYKPALTKISDSVSLADSTTAASATAAKVAYDRGTEALNEARQNVSKSLDDATGVLPLANGGTGRTDGQCPGAQALLLNGTFGGVQAKLLWAAQDAVTYLLGANPEGTGLYPILPNKVVVGEATSASICKGVFAFTGNHPQYLPSSGTWKGFTCPAQSGDLFFCGAKSGGDVVTNPTGALQYGLYVRTA